MIQIKSLIDYLFWKRTWFRMLFIIIPILPITFTFIICYSAYLLGSDPQPFLKPSLIWSLLTLYALGLHDNDNMDGCDEPLKIKRK